MTQQEWEELCNRCGLCCFEKKIDTYNRIITTRVACRYLDLFSRECKVYHKRFEVGEECQKLTPEVVAQVNWLPDKCAYKIYSLNQKKRNT